MLTTEEEKFITWWEQNRDKQQTFRSQISMGLAFGLLMGLGIILSLVTGWYTRAAMVANSQSTPAVLLLAVVLIVVFCSVFFKRHRWDMNEQRYKELIYKRDKETMQQSKD